MINTIGNKIINCFYFQGKMGSIGQVRVVLALDR